MGTKVNGRLPRRLTAFSLAALAGCGGASNSSTHSSLSDVASSTGVTTDAGDATSSTLGTSDSRDALSLMAAPSEAGDASSPTQAPSDAGDTSSPTDAGDALSLAPSFDAPWGAVVEPTCDTDALAAANSSEGNSCGGQCFCFGGQIICNDIACPPTDAGAATPVDAGASLRLADASAARVPASSVSEGVLASAVTANNAFAIDLYARLASDAGASNILTSPISASLALTMTYAGAQGQTATEMATALHFESDAGTAIFGGQSALSQALASRGPTALAVAQYATRGSPVPPVASDYELQVITSVWGEQTYPWAAPFLAILAESYGTGVYLEDFINQPDQARQTINGWVSAETDDKINNLLAPGLLNSSTRFVLVNAIHLKLPWVIPFDHAFTVQNAFTRADGSTVSPSVMSETAKLLGYSDDGQAQIVELPLEGHQVAVLIALPHPGVDLASYESALSPKSVVIAQPQTSAYVTLSMPKMTFTTQAFSLASPLMAMGMIQAFDPGSANFRGMCPNPPDGNNLYLSSVLQKATLAMQEDGVEAAAATEVGGGAFSSPPPSVLMVVDHPYLISIVDVPTGAVLFLGHIEDPTDSGGP